VIVRSIVALAVLGALTSCSDEGAGEPPPPHSLTQDATGHYCGMLLAEHAGPKGQILLASRTEPVWFSSVRDTLTFLQLPEEPKDVAAIYVSDMANAPSWEQPGGDNWILAEAAFFVVGSDREGGMGGAEAVPFSSEPAARAFAREHGGRVVAFDEAAKDLAGAPSEGERAEP
jgi:copper chaperone NosL